MTLLLLGLTEVLLVAVACGLLLLVAPLGAAAGALLFPGLYVRRLRRALISAPLAPVERPTSDPAPGEQPAYRQYFSGQAIADFGSIVRDSRATCQAVAAGAVHEISMISFTSNAAIFTWMFGVVGIVGVVVGACVGAIVVAALVTVHVVLLGILHFAVWSGIGLLRTLDAALLRIRGIRMTCGTCHHRISYPAYRCPSCRRPHTDVRPGVYGVLRRVCTCGTRIPTLLVLGTYLAFFWVEANPTNPLAVALSIIPPLSPILMPARMATGDAQAWQVILAVALAIVAIGLLNALAARIYANSVMRIGTRVKLSQAWRGTD